MKTKTANTIYNNIIQARREATKLYVRIQPGIAAARCCRGPLLPRLFFFFSLLSLFHFFKNSLCTLIFLDEKISYTRRKDDKWRWAWNKPSQLPKTKAKNKTKQKTNKQTTTTTHKKTTKNAQVTWVRNSVTLLFDGIWLTQKKKKKKKKRNQVIFFCGKVPRQ